MSTQRPNSKVTVGASYALATAFTRQWWRTWGCVTFAGIEFAQHRTLIELPRAQQLLEELLALPKADRDALAANLRDGQ